MAWKSAVIFHFPSWVTCIIIISTVGYIINPCHTTSTDSPVHYFTWSGFPVLAFREADNFVVTETPTQYSPKLFHFPVPFTFNGKPAQVVHLHKPTEKTKTSRPNLSKGTSTSTSVTPTPTDASGLAATILPFGSSAQVNGNSTMTPDSGFNPEPQQASHSFRNVVTASRISPNDVKLHSTFVSNGRPHSFFILKAPGRRNYESKRKSQRRRNKPKPTLRRILLRS